MKHLQTIYENNEIFRNNEIFCNLKFVLVTQLKLIASTLAVKVAANLGQKLDLKIDEVAF